MNKIAAADGISLVTDSHAESGWTWHLHAESQETLEKIRSRAWDTVILQVSETFGSIFVIYKFFEAFIIIHHQFKLYYEV